MKGPITAVGRKISQALKGKRRGAKSLGTKLNKIPNDVMGEMQMINTTGVQGAQNRSRFKGAILDKQARQGFSGYTPNAKSQQNKYMADTKKFLGGK